jgi:hypothetical protein
LGTDNAFFTLDESDVIAIDEMLIAATNYKAWQIINP